MQGFLFVRISHAPVRQDSQRTASYATDMDKEKGLCYSSSS
jgi:hypothetical protein